MISKILINVLDSYITPLDMVVSFLFKKFKIHNAFGLESENIDDRIKKLDIAKKHLSDSLEAIDELKEEAQKNKEELKTLLLELKNITDNKKTEEEKLNQIRDIIKNDVNTFKLLAGIPNQKQLKIKERIGFIKGILSSLIAAFIIWMITDGYKYAILVLQYITNMFR